MIPHEPERPEPAATTRDAELAGAEAAMRRAARRARRRAAAQGVAPAVFENGKLIRARTMTERRLLDPVHGFIAFRANEVDDLARRLIDTREFQRLRNIGQLGLADTVFPGATHSRFSHSIGAFHVARRLADAVLREVGADFDDDRASVAVLAALLRDVGRSPCGCAFEKAERDRGSDRRHEDRTRDIISGDTEIRRVLGDRLSGEIAKLLGRKEPADVYASVVFGQFDADRLDCLQRDRRMTGAGSGAVDCDWLIDNLRVGPPAVRRPGAAGEFVETPGFHIGRKAFSAAEEYVLARHRLYRQVYLHKTSMGAERMLRALLARVAELTEKGRAGATGLPGDHPLLLYYSGNKSLQDYLALDDATVRGALGAMSGAGNDNEIARLASALRARRLYKCFDAGELAEGAGADSLERYTKALRDRGETCLEDRACLTAYGIHRFDGRRACRKIPVERPGSDRPEDIVNLSGVLQGIGEKRIHRFYAPDEAARERLVRIWRDVNETGSPAVSYRSRERRRE